MYLFRYSLMLYMSILLLIIVFSFFFFFKQKTAYEMRISDWSSDVCSSDLILPRQETLSSLRLLLTNAGRKVASFRVRQPPGGIGAPLAKIVHASRIASKLAFVVSPPSARQPLNRRFSFVYRAEPRIVSWSVSS